MWKILLFWILKRPHNLPEISQWKKIYINKWSETWQAVGSDVPI